MACHLIDPDARQDVLAAAQRLKMARSAHVYVRGNTADFYDWLRHLKRGHLPEGPPVWICGDCHVGNLGPLAHSDGRVEIQIRDLDQTVIGNPIHDLVRLGLSLASGARGSDLPGVTTARILEQIIEGYAGASGLRLEKDAWSGLCPTPSFRAARLIIDTGDIFAMRLSQHVWRRAGRLNLHEPNYASGVGDGHGKRARAHVAGRSKQWITRSKSAGMSRAAAALSREHASPLRAAGRRSIVRSSTCRTWVPASRWKVPSEFPIHSILCFTTHPSAVAA